MNNNTFNRNMLSSWSSIASKNNNPFNQNKKYTRSSPVFSKFINNDNNDNKDIKRDPEYIKKLDLSYAKCLEELYNIFGWEEKISECKFKFDPCTGMSLKSYTF